MMPIGDPQDRFFFLILSLMIDSYILTQTLRSDCVSEKENGKKMFEIVVNLMIQESNDHQTDRQAI